MSGPAQSIGLAVAGEVGLLESSRPSRLHKATCGGRALRKESPTCRNNKAAHEIPRGRVSRQINKLALSAVRERQKACRKPAESEPRPE